MPGIEGYFEVVCCARRRGLFPGGVLVCGRCDYDHEKATVIPNENQARDVPTGVWFLEVPRAQES